MKKLFFTAILLIILCTTWMLYLNYTIVWTILSFLETKSRKEGILSVYIFYS